MSFLKHVAELIKKNKITAVECLFPTINATLRGKIMRGHDFADGKELRIARAVILQSINGEYCEEHVIGATDNDTILKPDYSTFKILPWLPQRAWVLHDCMNFEGSPSEHAPRNVLKKVLAPYFNSWRRYAPGTQAPVNLQWGHDNRTIGLRIPYSGAAARRVENRLAGSDANPYLAMAASLACGLRGMQEKLKPSAPVDDRDGYEFPRQIAIGLESAITQPKQSKSALELFGDDFINAFINVKEIELANFIYEVSSWDRRYLALQV